MLSRDDEGEERLSVNPFRLSKALRRNLPDQRKKETQRNEKKVKVNKKKRRKKIYNHPGLNPPELR